MSNDWIFYPCQMGEKRASIFFDHGIKESINRDASRFLLQVKITFKQPRPDGLSSQDEFKPLCALEDDLQSLVDQHASLYVGRITVGGQRYLNVFTNDAEADWQPRLQQLGSRHGYELTLDHRADQQRDGYWKDLFPGADDWQVIKDMRVMETLEKEGDDGTASRQIDHWAYFPTTEVAELFAQWLEEEGYVHHGTETTDTGSLQVRFAHEGTVKLSDITTHTIALRRKAHEFGGDYDGWETPVCK